MLTAVNYSDGRTYEVIFPSREIICHILSLERTLIGYMNLKYGLADEVNGIFEQLTKIRAKCVDSPMFIKTLAQDTTDNLIIELATNSFSFFVKYWHQNQ